MIRASEIVMRAVGWQPDGAPAKEACVCALCGADIEPGDLRSPLRLGAGFVDDLSLAARGSSHLCGWCAPLMTADGLAISGFGAFSLDGVRPFRKWQDIAAAILEPPEPPFVMLFATNGSLRNNQHMAWRAPVNLNREMFHVRVGLRDIRIRRAAVCAAIDACRILAEAAEIKGGKKTLPHPYEELSQKLNAINHGRMSSRLWRSKQKERPDIDRAALAALRELSLGETWALRFILTPNAGNTNEDEV